MGNGSGSLYASAKALPSVELVGLIGLTNLGLLTCISLWRTIVLLQSAPASEWGKPSPDSKAFRKKLMLHVLLLLATATDLPMYASFVATDSYQVVTYAFHKLECAFIFSAYSITITDWSTALYEINEDSRVPFLLKRGIIWTINLLVIIIAGLNFIYCLAMNNLNTYTNTPIYIIGVVTQLLASFLLTCVMLHGGIKLSWRIRGASGQTLRESVEESLWACLGALAALPGAACEALLLLCPGRGATHDGDQTGAIGTHVLLKDSLDPSTHSGTTSNTGQTSASAGGEPTGQSRALTVSTDVRSAEFLSALRCLNIVMASCASCEFMQMTLLWLNWFLGYADSQSETVGNFYFYWTFYAWVPLWGVVLSLLYLSTSRNSSSLRNKRRGPPPAAYHPLSQPLVDDRRAISRVPADSDHEHEASASSASFDSNCSQSRGLSTGSQRASDVFFRDIATSHTLGINYSSVDYPSRSASLSSRA